jgi:biotin synthase
MERVPVPGTPLGEFPGITEEKFAQIVAVTRLGSGKTEDICAHQPSQMAMASGANVAVVEKGAIPREGGMISAKEWNGFDASKAKGWFSNQSYQI